jgi:membrane-associated PAP2 superfamily phosphatase
MTSWFETYKPVASSQMQLWLAGSMWSCVGAGLFSVGTYWLLGNGEAKGLIILFIAVGLGLGKALLILDRTALRNIDRVKWRGEDRCFGGFLSWRVWILVMGMMLLGRVLRTIGLPKPILGLIYGAVGIGLLFSSRLIWRAWRDQRALKISAVENSDGK